MDDIRHVLVTTQYRGVYYGRLVAHDPVARQCILTDAHMAIYWGTTDGVDQLAARGPTATSKLGARALRIWIPGLTSLVDCTVEAVAAWTAATAG